MNRIGAAGPTVQGIDVSHWEPGVVWSEVAKTCSFAFLKATDGLTGVDSTFRKYWDEVRHVGMLRGAYHFLHPDQNPFDQAHHFLQTVGSMASYDLPPVLDWEVSGGRDSRAQQACAVAWLNVVENACGVRPIIYTGPSFMDDLKVSEGFAKYPLWISNYDVSAPKLPAPWNNWAFWQSSESAVVGGVHGKVDLNCFNGDLTALKKFALK